MHMWTVSSDGFFDWPNNQMARRRRGGTPERAAGRLFEDPQCRLVKPRLMFFDGVKADGA